MGAAASTTDARTRTAAGWNPHNSPQVMAVHPTQHSGLGNTGYSSTHMPENPKTSPTHATYPSQVGVLPGHSNKSTLSDNLVNHQHNPANSEEMSNRPGFYQASNPLPPIGFRQDVLEGPIASSGMSGSSPMSGGRPASARRPQSARQGSWNAAMDLTFMRVLSAEEFLGRMWETDEQITSWTSSDADSQTKYARIKDLLGLRGHLQDELLRIQGMFVEEDPDLNDLTNFEAEFPHVVNRLRELNNKSRRIQIQSTDIGLDPSDINLSSTVGTQMTPRTGGHNAGTQSQGQGHDMTTDTTEEVDENLRRRFVAEEDHVAGGFAERFARNGQQLRQEDIDKLLNEHALSMQALRKKQKMESDKHKELLDLKKRERLLNRRPAEAPRTQVNPGSASTSQAKRGSSLFFVDIGNNSSKGAAGKGSKAPPPKKDSLGPESGWFYVDMDGNTTSSSDTTTNNGQSSIVEPVQRQGTFTKDDNDGMERQRTFTSDSGTPIGMATRIPPIPVQHEPETSAKTRLGSRSTVESDSESDDSAENIVRRFERRRTFDKNAYDDDFEEDDSEVDEEKEDLKTTLKDDLWTTLREEDGTSKSTFQELMNAYRDQEEGRQAVKDSEKLKHKSSFLAKLAAKNKRDSEANEIQTQTDGVSTSSMSTGTDDPFEKELEAIKEKDEELVKKLMAKRKTMSEADFQELLKKHLSDIEKLRQQRARDQERIRDKLKQRLKQRRDKKGCSSDSSEGEDEASEMMDLADSESSDTKLQRELTALDEKLQKELRRKGKNIDESDLTELLEHYRRQQEALLKRRKGERNQINEKLKKKLQDKKPKTGGGSGDEGKPEGKDDSMFQELQRMQARGELTEEMFSSMMKEYLSQVDKDKTPNSQKRRQHDKKRHEVDRDAASTLVQEHKEHTKQIKGIRQRQKDILDQKLKKKLQAKKNKGQAADD